MASGNVDPRRAGNPSIKRAVGLVAIAGLLVAGCSSNGSATSAEGPSVLPTEGSQTDGKLSYAWHQDYTSPDATPSRYTISVKSGGQAKQVSADSIAVYIADDADYSAGDIAPVSLTITCSPSGATLAKGTYIRNDGGPSDLSWRSYSESGAAC